MRKGSVLPVVLIMIALISLVIAIVAVRKSGENFSKGEVRRVQTVETAVYNAVSYVAGKLGKGELACNPSPCDTGSRIVIPSFGGIKVKGVVRKRFSKGGYDYYLIEITAQKKDAKRTVEFLYEM